MTKIEMKIFRGVLEYKQTQLGDENRNSDCLRDVRSALLRVDTGMFGICVVCRENISFKCLAPVPWASSCITCQEALDRGQEMRSEIDHSLVMAA